MVADKFNFGVDMTQNLFSKRSKVWLIYLFVIILTLIVRIGFSFGTSLNDTEIDVVFSTVVQIVVFGIVPVTLYSLFVSKNVKSTFSDFGFKNTSVKNWLRSIAIGIAMTFCATFISMMWHVFLNLIGFKYSSSDTDYSTVGLLFLQIFITAILPGFFEELTHRGLLFAAFSEGERKKNKWLIVITSALMFAIMHQNVRQTAYTFFDGIILALMCYYTGSIFPSMTVHFLNNFSSVLSGYAEQNNGAVYGFVNSFYDFLTDSIWGLMIFVALFALAIVLIVLLFKDMHKEYVKTELLKKGSETDPFSDETIIDEPFIGIDVKQDIYAIVTVVLGVVVTLFTLIWGILR